jgi:hypothetical protein
MQTLALILLGMVVYAVGVLFFLGFIRRTHEADEEIRRMFLHRKSRRPRRPLLKKKLRLSH